MKEIEKLVSDAVVEKPIEFDLEYEVPEILTKRKKEFYFAKGFLPWFRTINVEEKVVKTVKEHHRVYPPTLGKLQLLSKLFLNLDIDFEAFKVDPATEIFKCCGEKTDVLAEIMAISILKTKEELLDSSLVKKKAEIFKWCTSPQDFALVVGALITQIDLSNFSNSIRLTRLFRLNDKRESKHGANRVEK